MIKFSALNAAYSNALALMAALALTLCSSSLSAQSLDVCEIDVDLSAGDVDQGCETHDRSSGWGRFGFNPGSSGLSTSGNMTGALSLTPTSVGTVRVARILPTQPTVWLGLEDARATLVPDEWIDVLLVRQSTSDSYKVQIVHWLVQGLTVSTTTLAESASFTQAGVLSLSAGWSYTSGQVSVSVSGHAASPLTASRSSFGSSLPWLSLPHFPSATADFQSAAIGSFSGSAN